MKKNSFCTLNNSIGLNIDQFELLLVEVVPRYSTSKEVSMMSKSQGRGLAYRYRLQGYKLEPNQQDEIVTILSMFLKRSPDLPQKGVALVHSLIGHVQAEQGFHTNAIKSYLKALFIYQKQNKTTPEIILVTTFHCLALEYGKIGSYLNASQLLEKVLDSYKKLSFEVHSDAVIDAQNALKRYNAKQGKAYARSTDVQRLRQSKSMSSMPKIYNRRFLPMVGITRTASNKF